MKFKSIVISYNCVQLFWFYIFYLFLCTILVLVEWGEGGRGEAQRPSQTTSSCLIVKVRQSPVKVGPSLFVGPCGEITKSLLHIPVKLPRVFRLRPVAALQF